MRISPEVEIAFSLAAREAQRRSHEYISVEHLLYALLFDEQTALVVRHAGGDPVVVKKELEQFLTEQLDSVPEDAFTTPTASLGVQRAIRRAMSHVQSSGKDQVTAHGTSGLASVEIWRIRGNGPAIHNRPAAIYWW